MIPNYANFKKLNENKFDDTDSPEPAGDSIRDAKRRESLDPSHYDTNPFPGEFFDWFIALDSYIQYIMSKDIPDIEKHQIIVARTTGIHELGQSSDAGNKHNLFILKNFINNFNANHFSKLRPGDESILKSVADNTDNVDTDGLSNMSNKNIRSLIDDALDNKDFDEVKRLRSHLTESQQLVLDNHIISYLKS